MPSFLINYLFNKMFPPGTFSTAEITPPPTDAEIVQTSRKKGDLLASVLRSPKSVRIEHVMVQALPVDKLTPKKGSPKGTLLHFHGGGWFCLSAATHRGWIARIAKLANVTAYIPDYRLAPEHPFPAAIEDALQLYTWLVDEQHVSPREIILGGDSAGGQIALALLLMLKEKNLPLPGGGILFSPCIDLTGSSPSFRGKAAEDPIVNPQESESNFRRYIGTQDPHDPKISPLFGDLSGLPPLCIQVGTRETLLDDSVRLAEKITATGGNAELKIWEGLFHVFPLLSSIKVIGGLIPECKEANKIAANFIRKIISQ